MSGLEEGLRPQDRAEALPPRKIPFETSLILVGLRCVARYLVLPFVLPLLGVVARPTFGILLVVDVIAIASILSTLRAVWSQRRPRRRLYFAFALVLIALILVLLLNDARTLAA
ncbi:hypothetical protein [Flindersiella endophytica]